VVNSPRWVGFLVALVSLGVYLVTLAPSVGFIDSGELAAVASTLGIAHPTGYPLFTLLGWVFSKLPMGSEEIVRLNTMSALLCAAGVFVFFQLMFLVLSLMRKQRKDLSRTPELVGAAGASFLLAFSETYWSQALSVEVYSLHALLMVLVLWTFVKASSSKLTGEIEGGTEERWWLLFSFLAGLSFANHMTTILLAPGLVYLYFALQGINARSTRRIGRMIIPFGLGLSPYFYLPIRSAQHPLFCWGDPVTLERFLWHLSGKQYSVWIFSSTEAAGRQFKYFLSSLPGEFAYVGLVLAIVGVITMLTRGSRKLLLAMFILFITCVLYSINYDIHDIDSYFLLAYLIVALWAGAGLMRICQSLMPPSGRGKVVAGVLLIVVSFIPLAFHFDERDESGNYLVEDYTRDMLSSVEPHALVLSFQWDYWVSSSYYYQYVRGLRRDVAVIDKELLRRSWYLKELEQRYPWLIEGSRTQVDAFLRELYKFEHGIPYDGRTIQAKFVEMIHGFLRKTSQSRPVYVTHEIEAEFTEGFQRVPQGLALKLVNDTDFHPTDLILFSHRPFRRRGRLEDMVRRLYADSYSARAAYYYTQGKDLQEAMVALQKALKLDPANQAAAYWMKVLSQ